jgi:hypothetical protein
MKYKTLADLPIEMRETDKATLYPFSMVCDILDNMDDYDYLVKNFDMSLKIVDNIKRMVTILSDNRIEFE